MFAGNSYSQMTNLSLDLHNTTIKEVLGNIEDQSNFYFLYNSKLIDVKKKINVVIKNENIDEVLKTIFSDGSVNFLIRDRHIVLTPAVNANQQSKTHTITGNVTDSSGASLPGVTVIIKGTTIGVITDLDGKYNISKVPDDVTLVFSFVGMKKQEVPVENRALINVVMQDETIGLDEVVAIGYGTVKKSDLTGSISSIKTEDIMATPTNNALEALQGKVSGLDLTMTSGQAGNSSMNILVRGERSLTASNSPLILVDGISYGSTLDINPSDIESMEVLKDASSTAIYGSRGANGVILINTKKGKTNENKISFNSYYSVNTPSYKPDIMSGEQYIQLRREAYRTTGVWNSSDDDSKIFVPLEMEYIENKNFVDWVDLALQSGYTQNYELSVSGGSLKTKYKLSLGYIDERGLLNTNDQMKRYNGRLSIDHELSDKLKVGGSGFFSYKDRKSRYSPMNMSCKILPIAKPYNDDGTVNTYPAPGYDSQMNPLLDDVSGAVDDNYYTTRFIGSVYFKWDIIKNLTLQSNLGANIENTRHGYFYDQYTLIGAGTSSESGAEITQDRGLTWENTLNYLWKINKNNEIQALLGTSTITSHEEYYKSSGTNQVSSSTSFYDLGSNSDEIQIGSSLEESQIASFFGRLNYNMKGKYLLTATMRADGSSVLAEGNKWGYFPSVSGAWRIIQEPFMQSIPYISNLKTRLSWGKSGNSAVDPYSTEGGLGTSTYAFYDEDASGYYPSEISNKELKWETTSVYDIGLDLGYFKNKLSLTLDFYKSKTSDLLMNQKLPSNTGYSSVMANVGSTKGKGLDITLSTININTKKINWSTDFTFSYNTNEITALSNGVTSDAGNNWFVGKPVSVEYDYKKIGIWQSSEEAAAALEDEAPGDIKVKDVNNDGKITTDDRITYNRSPKYTAGLNNRFSYKNFDFSFFITGRFDYYIDYGYYGSFKYNAVGNGTNVNYWTPENPTNDFLRPDASRSSRQYSSTLSLIRGDYIKIKNISLSYTIPKPYSNKWRISNAKIYMTLKNFFTLSDIKHYDPEQKGSTTFPTYKQIIFGLNINL